MPNKAFFDAANSKIRKHCKRGGRYQDSSGNFLLPTVLRVKETNSYCLFFISSKLTVFLLLQTLRFTPNAAKELFKGGIRYLVSSFGPEYHFNLSSNIRFPPGWLEKTQSSLCACRNAYADLVLLTLADAINRRSDVYLERTGTLSELPDSPMADHQPLEGHQLLQGPSNSLAPQEQESHLLGSAASGRVRWPSHLNIYTEHCVGTDEWWLIISSGRRLK